MATNSTAAELLLIQQQQTLQALQEQHQLLIQQNEIHQQQQRRSHDSPEMFGESPAKRIRFRSPNSRSDPSSPASLMVSQETKKLIISTCRTIVNFESSISKYEEKLSVLEQHLANGTAPKDLLLPKKKSLFEDEQDKIDEILTYGTSQLLTRRTSETKRKLTELKSRIQAAEKSFIETISLSREAQLKLVSPSDTVKIEIIKDRH